jgi:hypothetical protein
MRNLSKKKGQACSGQSNAICRTGHFVEACPLGVTYKELIKVTAQGI